MNPHAQHYPCAAEDAALQRELDRRASVWLNVFVCAGAIGVAAWGWHADERAAKADEAYASGIRLGRQQMAETVGDAWADGRRSALADRGCPRSEERPAPRPMRLVRLVGGAVTRAGS